MKRHCCIILSIFILFTSLTGCSRTSYPTDDVYHPETDSAYYSGPNFFPYKLVEGDAGYYFKAGNTLLFADKTTMEVLPLCSLPGCLHNQETDEAKRELCQAYFPANSLLTPIVYYNGSLYVCYRKTLRSDFTLVRLSPDGTKRREVMTIPYEGNIYFFSIHRGKLYYVTTNYGETGERGTNLWVKSFDHPREKPQKLRYSEGDAYCPVRSMIAYGNRLYLLENTEDEQYVVNIMDLRTEEWTVIEPFDDRETFADMWIYDGKLMLDSYVPSETISQVFTDSLEYATYRCELDGSNPEKTDRSWGNWSADEEYAYLVDPYTGDRRDGSLRILDKDFQQVDELPFADWPIEGGTMVMASVLTQNGDRQIVHIQEGEPHSMVFWYFDRSEIGSGQLQPKEFFRFIDRDYY